jgi:signal transduction histidine kinase
VTLEDPSIKIPTISPADIDKLLTQAQTLRFANYHESFRFAAQALELSRALSDVNRMSRSYNLMGWAAGWQGLTTPATNYVIEGLRQARLSRDQRMEGQQICALAYLLGTRGNYHDGTKMSDRAEEIAKQLGDNELLALCYMGRATLTARLGDSQQGFEYLERAQQIQPDFMQLPFARGIFSLLTSVVCQNMPKPDLDRIESSMLNLVQSAREVQSSIWMTRGLCGLSGVNVKQGNLAEAERLLSLASETSVVLPDHRAQLDLMDAHVQMDIAHERYEEAIAHLNDIANLARQLGIGVRDLSVARMLIRLNEQIGDERGTIDAYKRLNSVTQFLFDQQMTEDREIVQMVYDMRYAEQEAELRAQARQAIREQEMQAEQNRRDQEILNQKLSQEREMTARSQRMIARLSHEFRNPLTSIKTSASMLLEYSSRLSAERRIDHLQRINGRVDWLVRMLDDMSMAVLPLAEEQLVTSEVLDFEWVLESLSKALSVYKVEADRVRLEVEELQDGLQLAMEVFQIVMTQLLVNALRFSDDIVHLKLHRQLDCLTATITDSGIGIQAAELEAVREPLVRGSNTDEIPGLGMGLAIVEQCLYQCGGTLHIESVPGSGTTVTATFPV